MRYISDDNKVFNLEQECLKYEKALNEEKFKKERLMAEKNRCKDEVVKSYKDFADLLKKYCRDYDEPVDFPVDPENHFNALDLFSRLFPVRIW